MSEFRSPEQERAEQGADIRPVEEFTLEEINPFNAHLFSQHRWGEYFERLRREAPVHFNEIQTAGRYWSVTKYDDIKEVSPDCRDTDGYGDHT
jgi:cytochrome P450